MDLHNKILTFYIERLGLLPETTRFHFCSRLLAWEGSPSARDTLVTLKSAFVPEPCNIDTMRTALTNLIDTPPESVINAEAVRTPYFAKYPRLRSLDFALFRVRHWKEIYGIDGKEALLSTVPLQELVSLSNTITTDPAALRVLSTYAINYLYLMKNIFPNEMPVLDAEQLYRAAKGYDLKNREHLQLLIYLYTHCIIGATNFYTRAIEENVEVYARMIQYLEEIIETRYSSINLDNKLEFLVCCRICDYSTPLFERIYAECAASISEDGDFLVDRHNENAQNLKKSFSNSEHRNVLFIMSCTPYTPHSTLCF